jgi:hypothetical protein
VHAELVVLHTKGAITCQAPILSPFSSWINSLSSASLEQCRAVQAFDQGENIVPQQTGGCRTSIILQKTDIFLHVDVGFLPGLSITSLSFEVNFPHNYNCGMQDFWHTQRDLHTTGLISCAYIVNNGVLLRLGE